MTGADHENNDSVMQAAQWLADEKDPPRPIIPALRSRFSLSTLEATEACAMAQRFRVNRKAFG
ncbi:hypothetical protein AM571_CH01765 [Rhizobium etli 8C-3]|uniref:Uncharacterized protein n=1 Tax=Rhizobium etli 8C-3 TaxID=538025 RepID=A0A1L5P3A5_RHIET|nr:hypothetical protein [Rhizobium etli]APO74586.1 hypothetical protein AM571_CH01765 [Rhizobium etli 8C-3]